MLGRGGDIRVDSRRRFFGRAAVARPVEVRLAPTFQALSLTSLLHHSHDAVAKLKRVVDEPEPVMLCTLVLSALARRGGRNLVLLRSKLRRWQIRLRRERCSVVLIRSHGVALCGGEGR